MSGHSVTVKRADEVVAGDFINWHGSALEVVEVVAIDGWVQFATKFGSVVDYPTDYQLEVMDR